MFVLQARRILQSESSIDFLISLINKEGDKESTVDEVRVVREFQEVIPDDLLGMPPKQEVEFMIDLTPKTIHIAYVPYRMATKELQELKTHIEEL